MKFRSYEETRDFMQPGDVIAFGGRGFLPDVIKRVTNCPVSHVGILLQTNVPTWGTGYINQIIESTSLGDGFAGVQINRMSVHMSRYDGDIWWLPLDDKTRGKLDIGMFFSFLLDQVGKKYDAPQAIMSAIDFFMPDNREDLDRLFCSELDAAALKKGGVLKNINASEQTPADIIRLPIYSGVYQLKGDRKEVG